MAGNENGETSGGAHSCNSTRTKRTPAYLMTPCALQWNAREVRVRLVEVGTTPPVVFVRPLGDLGGR